MAKRKTFTKRSITKLPKGLPVRSSNGNNNGTKSSKKGGTLLTSTTTTTNISPFELTQRLKRPKFAVHNRTSSTTTTTGTNNNNRNQQRQQIKLSALAQSLVQRQQSIVSILQQQKKSNQFIDQRIGEVANSKQGTTTTLLSNEDKNLARLVRERTRQSKRISKYALNDDDNNNDNMNHTKDLLTHKGTAIQNMTDVDHVILSDDDDDDDNDNGNLDAYDTEMHFGGNGIHDTKFNSIYGSNSNSNNNNNNNNMLSNTYTQKKLDLDELIVRRKTMKLERLKSREAQIETFDMMDEQFKDIASLLTFRNKDLEIQQSTINKRNKTLSDEDMEYEEWDREMKLYIHGNDKKIAASDRTKTVEEIAKEEADRLHQLETRRLARMNGTFDIDDDDDMSDIDNDDGNRRAYKRRKLEKDIKKKKKEKVEGNTAEEVDYDDDDDNIDTNKHEMTTRFTSEGLVYVNKDGVIIGKVSDIDNKKKNNSNDNDNDSDEESDNDDNDTVIIQEYNVGDKVVAIYRAKEQFDNRYEWYNGVISAVIEPDDDDNENENEIGTTKKLYNIEYDDGDFEDNVEAQYIRPATSNINNNNNDSSKTKRLSSNNDDDDDDDDAIDKEMELKRKHQKAIEKARSEIPYVFEVPTTLDALHTMIGNYAKTGKDVSLIIERIHTANSVRLDRRNSEKMQNFYDVLLRRFVAVGDAIYTSGDGGDELCRYGQLDSITKILYTMAQESPDIAGAIWSRRLGLFHNAYTKRLRDFGIPTTNDTNESEPTAWPSTGVILLLRALGHVFPVTDKRHYVVTPTLLFLGQMLGHTPITSIHDLVIGTLCCGLLLEYTKDAKRIAPEAHAFLASVIRLYAWNSADREGLYTLPTVQAASKIESIATLRLKLRDADSKLDTSTSPPQLSFEESKMSTSQTSAAILYAVLHLVESSVKNLSASIDSTENEVFAEIVNSLILLQPSKNDATKSNVLPPILKEKVVSVVTLLSSCTFIKRMPLQRRSTNVGQRSIVTLAPRIENPDRYNVTQKDRHKTATQAAADRTRREYKREHKAVSRELRLDASMIETERRRVQNEKDAAAKAKRHRAYAWLEGEQASMNQQVRQGGGLLKGGGMGLAKAKAASGKLGIKKGGKLR